MKVIGKREFHNQQARLLRAVEDGETLEITGRGRVVARVVPPKDSRAAADREPRRAKAYKMRPLPRGSLPRGALDAELRAEKKR